MTRSFYLLLFGCILNLFNMPSLIANPIIGGYPDINHAFNHQVSIHGLDVGTNMYVLVCSGTIVSEMHILTAAHCFMNKLNGQITEEYQPENGRAKIIAGTNSVNGPGIEKYINQVFIPRVFENGERKFGDICVAVLESNLGIRRNGQMQTIPMGGPFHENYLTNKEATFSGYGYYQLQRGHDGDSHPVPYYSEINQFLNVVILPRSRCPSYVTGICARSMDQVHIHASCFGDSGAGLIFENEVIGVLSYGPQNCDTNEVPMVFTRISFFKDFVDRAMDEHANHNDMHILGQGNRFIPTPSWPRQHSGSGGYRGLGLHFGIPRPNQRHSGSPHSKVVNINHLKSPLY